MERENNDIQSQEEFNQIIVRALNNLYILTLGGRDFAEDINHELESVQFRDRRAELDRYAFRDIYAQMNMGSNVPEAPGGD